MTGNKPSPRFTWPLQISISSKKVNDEYGHPVGDLVLKQLASRLKAEMKSLGGVAARIGSEEFAVLLPGEAEDVVQENLDAVRHAIASKDFTISDDLLLPITISIGAAGFPRHKETLTELYKAADNELYIAKQSGRNCVRVRNGNAPVPSI
ncbi:GGDEF domain-containing protein [Chryseomicrobium palamuruense]|uniref:GGDEF domain-containing protein n=1 Tax=Chryseomicrobium palamuruense TaxID=682973 RepID=A0ABV8UUC0_9BACL